MTTHVAANDDEGRQGGARDIKRLPADALKRLSRFVGYGTLDAKVWFVGPEERLDEADEEAIVRHFEARLKFDLIEDCPKAHLRKLGCDTYHGPEAKPQKTWAKMSAIMVALRKGDHCDREALLEYQVSRLGAKVGETFLAELLPLPKPSSRSWPGLYVREFQFKGKSDYRQSVLQGRIDMLKAHIERQQPSVVLCYGKMEWSLFRALFEGVRFEQDKDDGMIEIGARNGTMILLTPHFTRGFFPEKRVAHVVERIKKTFPDLGEVLLAASECQ